MTLWLIAVPAAAGAAVVLVLVVMYKRRRMPHLRFDRDTLPAPAALMPTLTGATGGRPYRGNAAEIIQDAALFERLLDDIAAAEQTVHLETFVWSAGALEARFVDALAARARAGVSVRLLIDAVGAGKASAAALGALRAAGVAVTRYCPPKPGNWRRFNQRTHRKLLIVDGRVGYTFGHGIADSWLDGRDAPAWRDTGVRLRGPAVHGLQTVFGENWTEETGEMLIGPASFPELDAAGEIDIHVVSSACSDALSAVAMSYLLSIAAARDEVLIQNPYFAPDRNVARLLIEQARRGVRVALMLPGAQTDSPFVRRAGCFLYDQLLAGGVEIHEYQRTLNHQKVMVVDALWSHVGSTNFDDRSLKLNEEISVALVDRGIAAALREAFERDREHSRQLTLQRWRQRPRRTRLAEAVAYRLHEQL